MMTNCSAPKVSLALKTTFSAETLLEGLNDLFSVQTSSDNKSKFSQVSGKKRQVRKPIPNALQLEIPKWKQSMMCTFSYLFLQISLSYGIDRMPTNHLDRNWVPKTFWILQTNAQTCYLSSCQIRKQSTQSHKQNTQNM